MKKVVRMLGLCALVALAITSCKKNEEQSKQLTFTATISQPVSGDRTHIGPDNVLVWHDGNKIKVFNANGEKDDFTTPAGGDRVATFSGTLTPTDTYTAFYPVADGMFDGTAGTAVTLHLNNEQNYVANDFGNDTYPMAAFSNLDPDNNNMVNFNFHSPASVLRLQLKSNNTCTVKKIIVTGGDNDKLAGDIVYADFSNVNNYSLTNTKKVVTLDCGNGVTLGPDATTSFNIVLFGGTLSSGTTVVVKDMGENTITTLETTQSNTIPAEVIFTMPLKEVDYELVTVVTDDPTALTTSGATMNGHYVAPPGSTVTERGFYWSTVESDVIAHNSSCQKETLNGDGTPFSQALTGLTPGTYYFRAYAVNNTGENWGVVKHFTIEEPVPTVLTVAASSVNNPAGSATMNGQYTANGATITEVGFYYGTSQSSLTTKVTVTGSTATPFLYTLNNLQPGTYYFKAYAKTSTEILAQNVLSFVIPQPSYPGAFSTSPTRQVVFASGNLQFNLNPNNPQWRFAPEQWIALGESENINNMWARINYDYPTGYEHNQLALGAPVTVDITNGDHWMDLYCWGTSGAAGSLPPYFAMRDPEGPNGTGFYRSNKPWGNYTPFNRPAGATWYMPGLNPINGTTADWGVAHRDELNATISDPDKRGPWRTLTGSYYDDENPGSAAEGEWYYLISVRSASTVNGVANARFAKANINGVNGILLFPDVYTHPSGVDISASTINNTGSLCSENNYTVSQWRQMEAANAVFLPCTSTRWGWGVNEYVNDGEYPLSAMSRAYANNQQGYYWSSTHRNQSTACTFRFLNQADGGDPSVNGGSNYERCLGCSVRLARTVVGTDPE